LAGQALLAAPLQFVIQQQGQEVSGAQLAFGRLGGAMFEGQEYATEPELA
jgi:hypothetical protein